MIIGDDNHLRRVAFAGGLRDLAAFAERNLDFPVPRNPEILYSVIGESDESERETINRIAYMLGEHPFESPDGHRYAVSRTFGPVTFTASALTREYMAQYHAEMEVIRRFRRDQYGEKE